MRARQWTLILLGSLVLEIPVAAQFAQQPPQRDPQAVLVLQQSLAAMGGAVPADSVATGTVVIVAGSSTDTGTIRILTRGANQTAEQIQTTGGSRSTIYSRGMADIVQGTSGKAASLELAASSQSASFPLPLIAAALHNSDWAFQFIGLETLGAAQTCHLRFWNTFSSNPKLQHLAEFTAKDIWIDAVSGLPLKLSFVQRAGGGAHSRVPVAVFYSNYRNVGGVLYPFHIEESLNGTPWASITIESVSFNTGLTDTDFPVSQGRAR